MDRTFLEQVNINTKGERRMEQGNRHVDIIRSIGIWMSETRELRKKIVVQSTGKYNWDDILADFCSKEEILDKIFSNSFYFRKTQGYYASFLVQGLRVKDEEGFKYFLFYIFLREIVSVGMIKGSLILEKMVNKVGEYIHDTWGVDCEGRIFIDSGIPGSTILTELIDDLPRGADDLEDIVRKLCKICLIYWKAFFYDYGLAVYNISETQRKFRPNRYSFYIHDWPGYIFYNGEPSIYLECHATVPKYQSIRELIIAEKYKGIDNDDHVPIYLDGDVSNISESNIVLFNNEYQLNRWRVGRADYSIDANNIYYVDKELTRDEFKNMLRKFSLDYLSGTYNMSTYTIKKKMEEYGFPAKSVINNMCDYEFDKL